MNTKSVCFLFLLSSLGFAGTTTHEAPTGKIYSTNVTVMEITGGGLATLSPKLPTNCRVGQTCSFSNSALTYTLPDGSTFAATDFDGTLTYEVYSAGTYSYTLTGTASSDGITASVTVTEIWRSGWRGGITKTYTGGDLAVTK